EDAGAGGFDLLELAVELDPQPRDLDSEPSRLDNPREERGICGAAGIVQNQAERLASPLERDAHASVIQGVCGRHSLRVDVQLALRPVEAQREPRVGGGLLEGYLGRRR